MAVTHTSPSSLLHSVIAEAVRQEVADIIFSYGCSPYLKTEGKLEKLPHAALTDSQLEQIVSTVVHAEKMATLQQEHQVDLAYVQDEHRFRVNVFYQRGHLSVVMRYVKPNIRSLEELGMPELTKELLNHDNGLILMVGPTGSGKSTSLAAMVEHLNQNFDKHIITIEDPVEYVYENKKSLIEQREVGLDAIGFPSALRAGLREAPDVILLGEMRDLESISTAITVAETGHLVLSTVHANSAPGTIDRIVDIFPPGTKEQVRIQLADILIAVMNQRLVPSADGKGHILLVEVMIATPAVRNAIRTSKSQELPNIIQTGAGDGMVLLDDLLIKAAKHEEISKEAAMAYALDPETVRKAL